MTKYILVFILFFLSISLFAISPSNIVANKYIEKHNALAIFEMKRAHIPASITLAQGMLESDFGRGDLATQGNNHFSIKCGKNWSGETYYKIDDDKDKNGKLIQSCFRTYDSVQESYTAHSDFLLNPNKLNRYGFLFEYDTDDYVSWAIGLQKSGYATDKKYSQKLVSIIENYELFKFDQKIDSDTKEIEHPEVKEVSNNVISVPIPKTAKSKKKKKNVKTYIRNGLECIIAEEGETPSMLSQQYNISIDRLLSYNKGIDANVKLHKGDLMYLEYKLNFYKGSIGSRKYHKVKKGETLFSISQKYGITIKTLQKANSLPKNVDPIVGEKLYFRFVNIFHRPKYKKRKEKKTFLFED